MTLRNRVTPFGELEASPARGLFMGNRGALGGARGEMVRPWRGERWIICALEFKGRRRERSTFLSPGRYTPLFFLDEATALAAGHRPCAECRRADYDAFRAAWLDVHPEDAGPIAATDRRLHEQRTASRPAWRAPARDLPPGAMIADGGRAWLVWGEGLRAWTRDGYDARRPLPAGEVEVITPRSSVEVLRSGWAPVVHPSAGPRA